jgi:uncharacterized protein YodC (DUF2158 family)
MNVQQALTEERAEIELDIGDVVELNSGGPQMVITGIKGVMIHCEWFARSGSTSWHPDLFEADIHVDALHASEDVEDQTLARGRA